jgi:hypothetical protein
LTVGSSLDGKGTASWKSRIRCGKGRGIGNRGSGLGTRVRDSVFAVGCELLASF